MQLKNVTFDAADPPRLAAFWSEATGQPIAESSPYFAMLEPNEIGIRMLFIKVPEDKSAKNRMHVDFQAADREAEVERLVSLGATRHDTYDEYGVNWTTLADPEGNEFCVAREHN